MCASKKKIVNDINSYTTVRVYQSIYCLVKVVLKETSITERVHESVIETHLHVQCSVRVHCNGCW